MNTVKTGIEKRDADMRGKPYLETENEANRWVTFEIKSVEIAGPLEPGKTIPAKVRGILTVKQKPVERVVDATVTYIKLSPEQVEAQKRFGFTSRQHQGAGEVSLNLHRPWHAGPAAIVPEGQQRVAARDGPGLRSRTVGSEVSVCE